ncbi:hypothetical protein B566_EDAN012007 [Ephemera danica]|nr:hypothetical protein B566_EDAN012007 [Ephemera danica]
MSTLDSRAVEFQTLSTRPSCTTTRAMSRRKSYLLFPLLLSSLLANAAAVPVFNPEAKVEEITTESVTTNSNDHEPALQCVVGDVIYSLGDSVPASNSCSRCLCSGSNNVTCEALQCEHKPGCRTIQRSDQCCPDYICECKLGERTYDNGERIPEEGGPCQVCYCRGGTVQCAVLECFWRDDCEPRSPEGHVARPMNSSSPPEKLQDMTTTSELPVVKFQPVSKSENTPTEPHETTENLTEATHDEAAATTPEAPRTPTQDGGLVTESAVEAPSEPSSAPENLEARSSVTTTDESSTTPSYEEASTETPSKVEDENLEVRTIDDESSTTEHEEIQHTESPAESTTIVEEVINTVETSTEEHVEPRFADEPTEIYETTTVDSTTESDEKTTEIAEPMISTDSSTLVADSEQPIQSREAEEESRTEHELETTTLQSFTEEVTTENSIEARTEESAPVTDETSDVISTTDEITTENSLESRSDDSVIKTESSIVPLETSESQTETSTPEITTEINKSVVELLHDSVVPAVNVEEEHELVKNLSSNMDPAAEETKVVEENEHSIVDELSKSIEKAEFPFNTTHNETSTTTENSGYLFNDSAFPESEFVDTAAVLSPLSHPLTAPQSYNRLNEWRIAAIQDPESWRDEVDLAADPGAGADILILPWSQQHLRRRRLSHEDPVASYVHSVRTRRHL